MSFAAHICKVSSFSDSEKEAKYAKLWQLYWSLWIDKILFAWVLLYIQNTHYRVSFATGLVSQAYTEWLRLPYTKTSLRLTKNHVTQPMMSSHWMQNDNNKYYILTTIIIKIIQRYYLECLFTWMVPFWSGRWATCWQQVNQFVIISSKSVLLLGNWQNHRDSPSP